MNIYFQILIILAAIIIILLFLLKKFIINGRSCALSPNLDGKICIITGGNQGIGYYTAKRLVQLGATVILACRNQQKAQQAISQISKELLKESQTQQKLLQKQSPNSFENNSNKKLMFMELDLNELASVKHFTEKFMLQFSRLDILINNAGAVYPGHTPQYTAQGLEKQFGVNYLSHYYLTKLLLQILLNTRYSRVLNVSSGAHMLGDINFLQLNSQFITRVDYKTFKVYADSKFAQIEHAIHLQNMYSDSDFKIVALHPGFIRTNFMNNVSESSCFKCTMCCCQPLQYFFSKSPEQGAQTTLHCALIDFNELQGGSYYDNCQVRRSSNKKQGTQCQQLYDFSEKFCKEQFEDKVKSFDEL